MDNMSELAKAMLEKRQEICNNWIRHLQTELIIRTRISTGKSVEISIFAKANKNIFYISITQNRSYSLSGYFDITLDIKTISDPEKFIISFLDTHKTYWEDSMPILHVKAQEASLYYDYSDKITFTSRLVINSLWSILKMACDKKISINHLSQRPSNKELKIILVKLQGYLNSEDKNRGQVLFTLS